MAAADVAHPPADLKVEEPAPTLPDYVTDPNAVLKDVDAKWRFGRAPDYSKTRRVFAESEYPHQTPMEARSSFAKRQSYMCSLHRLYAFLAPRVVYPHRSSGNTTSGPTLALNARSANSIR